MCIPFYYFIPKSILSCCGAELNAIPRNPQELFRNRKIGQAYEAYAGVDYGFEGEPCG